MDAPPDLPAPSDPGRIRVRLADVGELAASLPHLIGFHPRESVVLVGLTGAAGNRIGLTARCDIPAPGHGAAGVGTLVRAALSDPPQAVVLAVVSEEPDEAGGIDGPGLPHRELVRQVLAALTDRSVPVAQVLLIRDGRWWSYDCPEPGCAPGAGTPLPAGGGPLAAASVVAGVVVEQDRAGLVGRLAPPAPPADRAMTVWCSVVAAECADAVLDRGAEAVAEESWAAVLLALARSRPGPPAAAAPLTDREVARLLYGLRDHVVRDRALQLALGRDAPAAEQLWTECTRRAPAALAAAPATLLAVSVWLRGDGAMANVALARALTGEPGYPLARLLAGALEMCLPPGELRQLVETAVARTGPA